MIKKAAGICVVSLLVSFVLLQFTLLASFKNKFDDSLFYFRGPVQDRAQAVVVVAIDEQSLQKRGDWPWPRSHLAWLIEKIKLGGPKAIGIDLLLDIPARGADARIEDGKLADIFKSPPASILPVVVKEDKAGRLQEVLFKPLDIFLAGNTGIAAVNIESDPADKITRDFRAVYGGIPSFPVAVCLEYLDCPLKDLVIPMHDGRARINYKCAKIDTISASDVLEPFFNPVVFFKGKIVLVGRTDLASKDFVNTPVPAARMFETQSMAGIEVWKEIIDMILARNFLHGVPPLPALLIAALLSIAICAMTLRSNKTGAVVLVMCAGLCALAFYALFMKLNVILPLLYFVTVCIVSYVFSFLYNFVVFQREKRKITAAFKSYISPHVLQKILSQKIDLTVGGKRKDLTMLFADIKSFTVFSDTHGPEEVLDFLKAYFSEMNKVIIGHNGIIDKLMGDGILAYFGDFTDSDTHAYDAVSAAIEMQKRIPGLQKRLGFDFQIRIGVHTGPVDVGNIGSTEHLDYTVIGRNVNLAQRLEANCEPSKVLISDATYQLVKERVDIADTREIPLKGFAERVKVHTIR